MNSKFEFLINIDNSIVTIDVKRGRNKLNSITEFRFHNKNDLKIKISSNQYGYNENNKVLTLLFYYFSFYLDSLKKKIKTALFVYYLSI